MQVLRATLILATASFLQSQPSLAQQARTGSVEEAAAVRDTLQRPPATPPFDAYDAVALPFRIVTYPLKLLGDGTAWAIGMLTRPGPPPPFIVAIGDIADWGLVPRVSSIGPRSGPGLQLRFQHYEPFYVESGLSIRGSQRHVAGLALDGSDAGLHLSGGWRRWPELHFWGIGADSRPQDRSDYRWEQGHGAVSGWVTPARRLRLDAATAYENNRVATGFDDDIPDVSETFEPGSLFGLDERTQYLRFDLATSLDFVDWQRFQPRGVRLRIGGQVYRGVDGTGSDFHRITAELFGYLPVTTRQYLALRGLTELNRADSGSGVPFTHLATVGGAEGNRGFNTERFRDRDAAFLLSEWRYEIWRDLHERSRTETFLFLDVSGVQHTLSDLDISDLETGYGLGMRYVVPPNVRFVWYLAFSHETTRFRVDLSWEF